MTSVVKFTWNRSAAVDRMRIAANNTLHELSISAFHVWLFVVPVGKTTKRHEAGELRDKWFAFEIDTPYGPMLVFGTNAPYAVHVEFGTGRMTARAPLRRTAGEIVPLIEPILRRQVAG